MLTTASIGIARLGWHFAWAKHAALGRQALSHPGAQA
jgi:hypothetical protein